MVEYLEAMLPARLGRMLLGPPKSDCVRDGPAIPEASLLIVEPPMDGRLGEIGSVSRRVIAEADEV